MKDRINICLNCGKALGPDASYCSHCGQSTRFRNLSIRHLFNAFLDAFFYFDLKLLKSFRDIWVPNKIIKDFLSGKRKSYLHPFRLLFILLIIFFTLLAISMRNMNMNDTLSMEEKIARYEVYENFKQSIDSLPGKRDRLLIDSISNKMFGQYKNYDSDTVFSGNLMGINFTELGISTRDMYLLSPDSLYKKYEIEKWYPKLVINQYRRVTMNLEATTRYVITNMLWGIILMTIVLAVLLQLLYIRHDVYYVENFMHVVIFHTQVLIIWAILLILNLFMDIEFKTFILASFIPIFLLFYNLKSYYGQSWLKTIVKYFIFHISYLLTFAIVLILIAVVSLLFF